MYFERFNSIQPHESIVRPPLSSYVISRETRRCTNVLRSDHFQIESRWNDLPAALRFPRMRENFERPLASSRSTLSVGKCARTTRSFGPLVNGNGVAATRDIAKNRAPGWWRRNGTRVGLRESRSRFSKTGSASRSWHAVTPVRRIAREA